MWARGAPGPVEEGSEAVHLRSWSEDLVPRFVADTWRAKGRGQAPRGLNLIHSLKPDVKHRLPFLSLEYSAWIDCSEEADMRSAPRDNQRRSKSGDRE